MPTVSRYIVPLRPNSIYHLFNHAVGSDNLFRQRDNYRYFLKRYADYISPVCDTFAYCLMPNHFHFLIRVRAVAELQVRAVELGKIDLATEAFEDGTFVMQQFKNCFSGYTKAYNKRFERRGALFLDHVRRIEVRDEVYFTRLVHYITTNAVHHGFCTSAAEWEFCSYHAMQSDKPTRLNKAFVVTHVGSLAQYNLMILGLPTQYEVGYEFEEEE